MDQQQIRGLYGTLRDISTPQQRYNATKTVVDEITDSGISLPKETEIKVERARGLLSYGDREDIANSENMKTTIEELKEALRTIYSMVEHGTTGDEMADESELITVPGFSNSISGRSGGMRRKSQTARFCRCIKSVRKTLKARKGSTKEQGAIAVCVKSVLHTKGKTIKKFKCGKKMRLVTQKRK